MSTTNQKDDAVIAWVKAYMSKNPDSHVAPLFLYADPSANHLDVSKPESYNSLQQRCMAMNLVPVEQASYNYEGTERNLNAVSITARNRHVLTVLSTWRNLVELIRLVHHVKSAKGEEWPVDVSGKKLTAGRFPAFKLPILKSLLSTLNKALIGEFPTFVDEVYKAKYKNSGSFSYSLAETKLFTLKNRFLDASLKWIGSLPEMNTTNETGGYILIDNTGRVTRDNLAWMEWYKYTFNPKDKKQKFAETYEKLASAVCARIGKLKYENPPAVNTADDMTLDSNSRVSKADQQRAHDLFVFQRDQAELLMDALEFHREQFFDKKKDADGREQAPVVTGVPDVKKKVFQTKLYEHLLRKLQNAHEAVADSLSLAIPSDDKEVVPPAYKDLVKKTMADTIGKINNACHLVGIEKSLVYLDMLESIPSKPFFNRKNFEEIAYYFSQTGVCNDRVINSITKFISCNSQKTSASSRKMIPLDIELTIVEDPQAITKIKITESIDPAIVFSRSALESLSSNGSTGAYNAARFAGLVDKTSPGQATGYLQRGVMSLTSALKLDGDKYQIPQGLNPIQLANGTVMTPEDQLRYLANELDEMANLFQGLVDPILAERKKKTAADNKLLNKYKKFGFTSVAGLGGSSPSQAYISGGISPSAVFQGQGVFQSAMPFIPAGVSAGVFPVAATAPTTMEGMSSAAGHQQTVHHSVAVDSMPPPVTQERRDSRPSTPVKQASNPFPGVRPATPVKSASNPFPGVRPATPVKPVDEPSFFGGAGSSSAGFPQARRESRPATPVKSSGFPQSSGTSSPGASQGFPQAAPFGVPQMNGASSPGVSQGFPQAAPFGVPQMNGASSPVQSSGFPQSSGTSSPGDSQGFHQAAPFGVPQMNGASSPLAFGVPQMDGAKSPFGSGVGF